MVQKYKIVSLLLLFSFLFIFLSTTTSYFQTYSLDNKLEVFLFENHSVPLVTIQIAFRCGSISQTKNNAGLFHLFEHMLFKGNKKYETQSSFSSALQNMGTANWNGGTSYEHVYYFITIPSSELENGLEFWSYAVIDPLLEQEELEKEKEVVINEIKGYHTSPDEIYSKAIAFKLFPKFPERKDIDGPIKNISNATIDQLMYIKNTYYIPNNASLYIGGDINPENALLLAKKYFSRWEKGGNVSDISSQPTINNASIIYPHDNYFTNIGHLQLSFRGPDVLIQTEDTYTADVLLMLLSNPSSTFKKAIFTSVENIYNQEKINVSYATQRDGATVDFGLYFLIKNPSFMGGIIPFAEHIKKVALNEFVKIVTDLNYFSDSELNDAKSKLVDTNLYAMENANSALHTVMFWWATANTNYLINYEANCLKTSKADIQSFISKYILNKNMVTSLRLGFKEYNSDKSMKSNIKKYKYEIVNEKNAFWWKANQ